MKRLYESLQNRDAAAWDEFYEMHVRELYGFVFRLMTQACSTSSI